MHLQKNKSFLTLQNSFLWCSHNVNLHVLRRQKMGVGGKKRSMTEPKALK